MQIDHPRPPLDHGDRQLDLHRPLDPAPPAEPLTKAATLREQAERDREQADLVLRNAERIAADLRNRADRAEADADLLAPPSREPREPWWVNHADHMKGWEAFGVTGREPTVRRLGVVTFKGGKATTEEEPGTTPFGSGEVRLGVAGIQFSTHADDPTGAYILVIGTTKEDVEARWLFAVEAFASIRFALWPSRRP